MSSISFGLNVSFVNMACIRQAEAARIASEEARERAEAQVEEARKKFQEAEGNQVQEQYLFTSFSY